MNAKDFILQEDNCQAPETKKRKTITYETVMVSGPDFAIRRITPKTSNILAVMVSVNQFYIKNENTDETVSLSETTLRNFLSDLPNGEFDIEKDGVSPFWVKTLKKGVEFSKEFWAGIQSEKIRELYVKNLSVMTSDPSNYALSLGIKNLKWLADTYSRFEDRECFKKAVGSGRHGVLCGTKENKAFSLLHGLSVRSRYPNRNGENLFDKLFKQGGYGLLENYISKYMVTPVGSFPDHDLINMVEDGSRSGNCRNTSFEPAAFINYLFCGATEQGMEDSVYDFIRTWKDCLNLQFAIYGKVVDKYPENLLSYERKLSCKAKNLQSLKECEEFEQVAEELRKYEYRGKKYSVLVPRKPLDMIEEAQAMSNCLAGRIPQVASKTGMIFFLRKNDDIDKALVDIEIMPDGSLGEVSAARNKEPSDELKKVVNIWYEKVFLPMFNGN